MGIYVCTSDGKRKPFALSGHTQGQRVIDGVNSEWQGAETQLLLFVRVFSLSPLLAMQCFYMFAGEVNMQLFVHHHTNQHALKPSLLYYIFYSKWDHNLLYEHHSSLKMS